MTATIFQIPIQPGIPQSFGITLAGVSYELTLQYRDSNQGGWTLDIFDVAGNLLVGGIPLVTGANLLEQYAHLGFGGGLYVQTTSDPDAVPTFENLGVDGLLYWVSSGAPGTSLPASTAAGAVGAPGSGGGVTGPPGAPGAPGLSSYLTTPAAVLPADSTGAILAGGYAGAAGQMRVFSGTAEVTGSCTFAVVSNSSGLTTSIDSTGHYSVTNGMGIGASTATVQYAANYNGVILSANFVLSKAVQGATGPSGSSTPTLSLSNAASTVYAYSSGTIGSVAGLNGFAKVFSGTTDVTSSATFSLSATGGITATINTAANTPVGGQPAGYYTISAITAGTTTGLVTVTAVYSGVTMTAVYSISVVPAGIEQGSSLPATNLFAGRVFYNTTNGLLYTYKGGAWTQTVNATDLSGSIVNTQIASISASKLIDRIDGTAQITAGSISGASIAANAISAGQLTVTGAGAALNDDPNMLDSTAWAVYAGSACTFATVTDGEVGNGIAKNPSAGTNSWMNGAKKLPLDPSKVYRVRAWMRTASGSGSTAHMGAALFDNTGTTIAGDGLQWYFAANAVTPPGSWTLYSGTFGPGTAKGAIPSNARTMAPLFDLSVGGAGTGVIQIQDLRIEEVLPSALIVDGAITTQKIAANAVTASQIAAGTITATQIAAGTITADRLVAGSITAAQIAAGTVTATQIAAGTITGTQVAAGTLTASNIDSRGLTIKDGSGNIIFGSGASIDPSSYLSVPGAWQNANIAINANGTLSGAGTGQVTIGGLGFSGALDSTRNVLTYSSSAPGTPANGDIWVDTSVNPNVVRVRVSGAWQVSSNLTTNTNQLSDGANLGGTAVWSGVSGTGKPADNATKNVVTYSSSAPSSPTDGDIWVDTGPSPPVVHVRISGAWNTAASYTTNTNQLADGAGLGTTAVWSGVSGTGKPADGATKNIVTYSNTSPVGAQNGDIWVNTFVNPNLVNVFVSGAFQPAANYTTNTNQLSDGANLGGTAVWSGVSGTGKPADNSTKNTLTVSSTTPVSPTTGDLWFDTTNSQFKVYSGGGWNVSADITSTKTAANIAGQGAFATVSQITAGNASTYIASAAIGAAQIGSLNANVINAGFISASLIAAGTIVSSMIAAGTIVASNIAAGAITADRLSVTNLSAISANIGTLNQGTAQNVSGAMVVDLTNGRIVFNNGVTMKVTGNGFGGDNDLIEWFGPTQLTSGSPDPSKCNRFNSVMYLATNGDAFFSGRTGKVPVLKNILTTGASVITVPAGSTTIHYEMWGGKGGAGSTSASNVPGGGGGSGAYTNGTFSVTGGQTLNCNVGAGSSFSIIGFQQHNGGTGGGVVLSSGTKTINTITANGGAGGTYSGFPGNGGTITNTNSGATNVAGNNADPSGSPGGAVAHVAINPDGIIGTPGDSPAVTGFTAGTNGGNGVLVVWFT